MENASSQKNGGEGSGVYFLFLSCLITVLSQGEPGAGLLRRLSREVREVTGFVAPRF